MSQGYITLATGPRQYLEMAINLLASIKYNDRSRETCIVLDEGESLPEEYRVIVDRVAYLKPAHGFYGCLNKLRLLEISPFDETIFVDADCILVKNDMDRHWAKFQCDGFSIAGAKVTQGDWYGFRIAEIIEKLRIPYMVKMNSGVFYFAKGRYSDEFFETAIALVDKHKNLLGQFHRNRLQLADEPFIGAALGVLNIAPLSYDPGEGSIMITTVNASNAKFDPINRVSEIVKFDDFRLMGRFFPKKKVNHSPSFAHFVKLKPRSIYLGCANQLRQKFGLSEYKID